MINNYSYIKVQSHTTSNIFDDVI